MLPVLHKNSLLAAGKIIRNDEQDYPHVKKHFNGLIVTSIWCNQFFIFAKKTRFQVFFHAEFKTLHAIFLKLQSIFLRNIILNKKDKEGIYFL